MLGHPFGIGAAVTNYNRGAEFATHVTRILWYVLMVHFYDDALIMGFSTERGWAQYCYRQFQGVLGTRLDSNKAQLMASRVAYIGVVLDFQHALGKGSMQILPKEGRLPSIAKSIEQILASNQLKASDASSLMGKLNFLSTHAAGNLLRGCLGPLARRAHNKSALLLEPVLSASLQFAQLVCQRFKPKVLQFLKVHSPITLYYTDAMWEPPAPAGLGIYVAAPGMQHICAYSIVPADLIQQLQSRVQQIGPAEALACLLGPYCLPQFFQDQDVIHFVDNTSALAGCIAGGCSVPDMNCIFQLLALKLAELSCRYWAEYVESAANLADEPSRGGAACPVAESLGAKIIALELPPIDDLWSASLFALKRQRLQVHSP